MGNGILEFSEPFEASHFGGKQNPNLKAAIKFLSGLIDTESYPSEVYG